MRTNEIKVGTTYAVGRPQRRALERNAHRGTVVEALGDISEHLVRPSSATLREINERHTDHPWSVGFKAAEPAGPGLRRPGFGPSYSALTGTGHVWVVLETRTLGYGENRREVTQYTLMRSSQILREWSEHTRLVEKRKARLERQAEERQRERDLRDRMNAAWDEIHADATALVQEVLGEDAPYLGTFAYPRKGVEVDTQVLLALVEFVRQSDDPGQFHALLELQREGWDQRVEEADPS